jgi:hypothetical protein
MLLPKFFGDIVRDKIGCPPNRIDVKVRIALRR